MQNRSPIISNRMADYFSGERGKACASPIANGYDDERILALDEARRGAWKYSLIAPVITCDVY
jgi:hypothetical protein